MGNRISHSAVRLYSQCGKRYFYHYSERLRSPVISGALLFGSAVDAGLNDLLMNRDIHKARKVFIDAFSYQAINGVKTFLPTATNVVYAKTDYDADLASEYNHAEYEKIAQKKQDSGFDSLTEREKLGYARANWDSMSEKGKIMIDTYAREVLPQIKKVLAIQKNVALKNEAGDEIVAYLDLVAEMNDGKRYILDNKTSTRDYEQDSAARSQQLLLYHHICKEEYKIDGGVGFIVIYKQIQKNRIKICSVCGFNGSGARHKTCSNEVLDLQYFDKDSKSEARKRCNGEWKETIDPKARIEVILNSVPEAAEDLVMDVFDAANTGITNKQFIPNLQACGTGEWSCPYSRLCWEGKDPSLVKV